jgi:ribonuclease HI
MERMVVNRLSWYLESKKLINPNQSGFRQGRTTADHIIRITNDIKMTLGKRKNATVAIFLDMEKAFDLMWRKGVLYKICTKYNICGKALAWIQNFLTDRKIRVRINDKYSETHDLDNGTPQGSVLSPLIFSLMANDIPKDPRNNVKTSIYADDIAYWCNNSNPKYAVKRVQAYTKLIETWASDWGFKISREKTQAIVFTRKRSDPNKIRFYGEEIPYLKEIKFLGIHLHRRLNWSTHIEVIRKSTKSICNMLRAIKGQEWGASRSLLLKVYRALLRSKQEYACAIYECMSKSDKLKLDSTQYQALKIIANAAPGTSKEALQSELGEPPLGIRRLQLQTRYAAKVIADPHHPTKTVYLNRDVDQLTDMVLPAQQLLAKLKTPIFSPTFLNHPFWDSSDVDIDIRLTFQFDKETTDVAKRNLTNQVIETYNQHIQIYTDGSKKDKVVGCAYHIPQFGQTHTHRIPDNLSVYTSELTALLEATKWCLNQNGTNFVIFTDSLSSLQALQANTNLKKGRADLLTKIKNHNKTLRNQNKFLTYCWIPAHVGVEGNEKADELAKQALAQAAPTLKVRYSSEEVKPLIKEHTLRIWNNDYKNSRVARRYKSIYDNVSYEERNKHLSTNRRNQLFRIASGYNNLNFHKHLWDKTNTPSPKCDYCPQEDETAHHLIMDCIAYDTERDRMFNALYTHGLKPNFKEFITDKFYQQCLFKFLDNIQVRI